jgi:transcriptional regulator with XRE-family HTH domain
MIIGDRLKTLRETTDLSQGDIGERTGLQRCYVSRVENGHTIPSAQTLEKYARALELPMYQLMYDGDAPPTIQQATKTGKARSWESSRDGAGLMRKLNPLLEKMDAHGRELILLLAQKAAAKENRGERRS